MQQIDVIILGVNKYSFRDKQTNNLIEGCNIHYINKVAENDANVLGHTPLKATLRYEEFDRFKSVTFPSHGQATIQVSLTGNKPTVKIRDFKPLTPVKL